MTPKKIITASTIVLLSGTASFAAVSLGDILMQLNAQGYNVQELENEGSTIEAEVEKDGVKWELVFDADTGAQISASEESSDDSDDDDDSDKGNDDKA